MHILFRTIGQQMGMQLVRGILPESIDVFLNKAILEKCRAIVQNNVQENLVIDKNKLYVTDSIGEINALRTLYKEIELNNSTIVDNHYNFILNVNDVLLYTSFKFGNGRVFYPTRIIEHDKLDFVLKDYCNSPSLDYPILSIVNEIGELYIGNTNLSVQNTRLKVDYIELPEKVDGHTDGSFVDCNLPAYLHTEIVENAVQLYFKSVNNTTNVKQ